MKTNGVEKNSEDNHLNKIKIKVKKKRLEKKCDHKSFSTSSGFVFTYQNLFLPMWSVIAAYILSYQQKNKVRFNNKHTVSNENKTERLMSRYLRSLLGYSELLFTFAHIL